MNSGNCYEDDVIVFMKRSTKLAPGLHLEAWLFVAARHSEATQKHFPRPDMYNPGHVQLLY